MEHTKRMNVQYAEYTANSVQKTVWVVEQPVQSVCGRNIVLAKDMHETFEQRRLNELYSGCETTIRSQPCGTTEALYEYYQRSGNNAGAVLLNFASATTPGGGFINGSVAQEEVLCSESNLYNVLTCFDDVYTYQRQHTNKSLYADSLLYTPMVVFEDYKSNRVCEADVITCAAPNKTAAMRNTGVDTAIVERTMVNRIKMILETAAVLSNRSCLILGAYGCGVFGNDAQFVARVFKGLLAMDMFRYAFREVIYAVPLKPIENAKAFGTCL